MQRAAGPREWTDAGTAERAETGAPADDHDPGGGGALPPDQQVDGLSDGAGRDAPGLEVGQRLALQEGGDRELDRPQPARPAAEGAPAGLGPWGSLSTLTSFR